ncbi:hypothetical protein [Streptomyces sp. NBC_01565]|uniref:hypothetical protein n=1 Tax=unclassified Streptomyces TaxID=2593676 RepID=UPI00224FD3BA|nr:hypothetical protein [Streptomyces sp. NBC_01565]MCX4546607.1 hypothetical protein [Streptomyces sp. NBC_01565]
MGTRLQRLFKRISGTTNCVVPEKKKRFKPTKAFVIVILLAVLATVGLSLAGMPPATSVQVVVAVIAGVEAVRRLTASTPAAEPGVAR